MMTALFIFRRDLRLFDNTALNEAFCQNQKVVPCFFLDPRQLQSPYRSDFLISFMIKSLRELDEELKKQGSRLHLFYGPSEEVLEKLITEHPVKGLYFNCDYTPFSKKRDQKIKDLADKHSIECVPCHDTLLLPPETLKTTTHKPYTVFTPFYRKALLEAISRPQELKKARWENLSSSFSKSIEEIEALCQAKPMNPLVKGGRKEGLALLESIKCLSNYAEVRNIPSLKGTTQLSAHNKFGTISIREFYWRVKDLFGKEHTLISELFWRDFYTQILHHYPHVLGKSFIPKYDQLKWENDPKKIKAWKEGLTGFPIVDAGMRQLNQMGWMHNRVRMITSSFLIKDLHVDWRIGEQYFAQKLVDYDPAVNNGSWQWAASTGCDAQPYFRIFNPWLQQKRFDEKCEYIKTWVEELKETPIKEIHNWRGSLFYPAPIVDHAIESKKSKELYGACS